MSTKNTMKHNAVITTMLLLVLFTFSACASVTPDDQTSKDSNITENGASTGCSDYDNTSTPEFFNDLGKTLDELKNEHPEGNVIVRPDGFPDSAAICFGASESEYPYCFFGAQSGDAEKAMNEYEDQLECARLIKKQREVFGSGYRKKPQNMTRTAALRFRNTQKRSRANKNRI